MRLDIEVSVEHNSWLSRKKAYLWARVCKFRYSFSFQIANCSQGRWNRETGEFYHEINAHIDQAFANVEHNLQDAGGEDWSQVSRVNSYHVLINDEALAAMVRNFEKYMPNHQPISTCVGVTRLGGDDMRFE